MRVRDESSATVTSEGRRYEVYIFDKNKLSEEIAVGELNKCSGAAPNVEAVYTLVYYLA